MASPALLVSGVLILLFAASTAVRADVSADQKECSPQLISLAVCLPYVGGDSKAPTPDCCSALKGVIGKSNKCLCLLIKDRNDPDLGLKIDLQRALGLPGVCGIPSNVSECPRLLNLPANSPEARVFTDFRGAPPSANSTGTGNSGGSSNGKAASSDNGGWSNHYNGGGGRWWWLGVEAVGRLWFYCFASLLIIMGC